MNIYENHIKVDGVKGKEAKIMHNGTTADVNSLYPSMMSSESGNYYPVGKPTFWKGDYIPDDAIGTNKYYFIRIHTKFRLKDDMLPFIQIKGNYLYRGNECLESSDIYDRKTKKYYSSYTDIDGNIHDTRVTLTLTMVDFKLFLEHYVVSEFEVLDGCYFLASKGIFDDYINKYKKIKLESKGALRTLAKLFLNNLYGKMASSTISSFKVAYLKPDQSIGFMSVPENNKDAGYIAVGSAITSYARNFTIRAAQKNYYGVDKKGFIYADTDSINCDLLPDQLKGIEVDDKNFCCWKLESCWNDAIFTRQKTYIEHVTHENLEPIAEPYYNIKCAGMPEKCKKLFEESITGWSKKQIRENEPIRTPEELDFLLTPRTLSDFKVGLKIYGKLLPCRIKGGVILVEGYYEMREII